MCCAALLAVLCVPQASSSQSAPGDASSSCTVQRIALLAWLRNVNGLCGGLQYLQQDLLLLRNSRCIATNAKGCGVEW
jgi:hypothetical protein